MNVCMISGLAKHSGGVENVVNELAQYLTSRNDNVTVFGQSNQDFIQVRSNLRTVGVRPYDLLPSKFRIAFYNKLVFSLKVRRTISKFGDFDLIHGHADNCFFPALFRGKTPFLMTFHGTWAKSQSRLMPLTMTVYSAEKIAAHRCDLAIACSEAVKTELIELYGIDCRKITVIHNGVDVNKFAPENKALARQQLKLPLDRKYVLWVGGAPFRKGLFTAVKAVEKTPNTQLLVVGLNGVSSKKTLYLGKIPESDLIAAYNAADLLVLPTLYEGFPVTAMEALACGLPIVVSKESNMGELIKQGTHGFVLDGREPDKYREKIELMLSDTFELERMSKECRSIALNYGWKIQAQKYLKIYQKLSSA